jgi:hypothetical protein
MNRLPLAEIKRVYAVQHKEILLIVAEGYASGSGGSLHIWKSRTKIYPVLFEIYEKPGDADSNSQAAPTRVPVVAASVFPGRHAKIQVVCANDRIFPKIIEAIEAEPEPAAVEAGGAPELAGGVEKWVAIHEYTPVGPPKLRVEGNTMIPNLGVAPKLVRSESQGIDSKTLLLNVVTEPLFNVQGDVRSRPVRSRVLYEEETDYPFESVQIESIHQTIFIDNIHHQMTK